jgi:hypothetical protein|tara:strand:+ start:15 stop:806 length:792 start_codon:yes stop_codon:yes gene_type:complete
MTQTTVRPASEKQLAFAEKLIQERVRDEQEASQYRAALPNLTTKSASEVIDHLLALPAPAPLAYQGPEADHVMVSKRHGKCALCGHPTFAGQAHASVVAKVWSSYHFAGECPEGEVQSSGIDFRQVCEEFGRHSNYSGKDTYTLRLADPVHADGQVSGETRLKVKITYNQTTGWVNVRDCAEYGQSQQYGSQRPGAEYVGDASAALTRMLADVTAAAVAYGQITSTCGICGLALESDGSGNGSSWNSVAEGVGPVCAEKIGLR